MTFITDRTREDVLLGNEKGFYNFNDMNRVESAVAVICDRLRAQGTDLQLTTKTNWALPGAYSPETWPTEAQLERYLGNVKAIRDHFAMDLPLPNSMDYLTCEGANEIEQVLERAYSNLEEGA